MNQMEREEESLYDDFNSGLITQKELNAALRELQRDYQGAAEEAADQAYRDEMDRW